MSSDPLQAAWQSQPDPQFDADRLVQEFRRGERQFARMIFLRDVREVGVSLVMLPLWVAMGVGMGLPWSWYLVIPGLLWIAAFMTIDRMRQKKRRAGPGDSLVRGVEGAMADVEHQIWLLRNVFWWYQLPVGVPILVFFGQTFWQLSRGGVAAMIMAFFATSLVIGFVGAVNVWIYRINQEAVRSILDPRREELAAMLRSLSDEPPPSPSS
ncbi:hypothetical protein [Paludisphaera sp.]|uniref:hypothetical protein n=1 Tax=Paludisphaera sp. TaxID=2017432 RepID=UPI00301C7DB1